MAALRRIRDNAPLWLMAAWLVANAVHAVFLFDPLRWPLWPLSCCAAEPVFYLLVAVAILWPVLAWAVPALALLLVTGRRRDLLMVGMALLGSVIHWNEFAIGTRSWILRHEGALLAEFRAEIAVQPHRDPPQLEFDASRIHVDWREDPPRRFFAVAGAEHGDIWGFVYDPSHGVEDPQPGGAWLSGAHVQQVLGAWYFFAR